MQKIRRDQLRPWIRNKKALWPIIGFISLILVIPIAICIAIWEAVKTFIELMQDSFEDNIKDCISLIFCQVTDKTRNKR